MAKSDNTIRYSVAVDGDAGLRKIADGLHEIAATASESAPKAKELLDQLVKLSDQQQLIQNFVREKAALSDLGDEINRAGARLNDLQAKIAATATPSATLSKQFASAQANLQNLTASYGAHEAALARTSNALQAAGVDTAHLDTAQRAVQGSIAAVANEAQALGGHLENTAAATEHAGEKAHEAGGFFGQLKENFLQIVEVLGAVELAMKAFEFGSEAIKGAAEVEASLSRTKALAQGSAEAFGEFGKAAEEAAAEVNVSSQTATAGLGALVSQGLSADKAISALVPTLQAAKIANVDVNAAAAAVAQTLKAFDDPALSAATIVDQLTVASHGAAGGLSAMATAAAQLAPDAKQLGLNFTQTVGILGELSARGVDSEKAVRGLRTVFQDLENPTSKLRGDLLALGDGSKGFAEAVAALTQKTPQAKDALNGLSGEARAVVLALGQAGPDAVAQFVAQLQNAGGAASRTAKLIDDNLTGAYKGLTLAVDRAAESLAEPVLEPFKEELQKLTKQVDEFTHTADFDDLKKSVAGFAQDAVHALDELIKNTDWHGFVANAKEAIQSIQADFKTLADNASTIATALGKGADVIGSGFRATAGAIDGLNAAGAKAGQWLTELVQKGAEFAGASKQSTDAIGKLSDGLGKFASSEADAAAKQIGKIKDNLVDLAGGSKEAAQQLPSVAGAVRDAGEASEHAAAQTGKQIEVVQSLALALQPLPDTLQSAGTASQNFAERLAQASKTAVEFKDKSGNAVTGAEAVKTALEKLGSVSQQSLQAAADGAAKLFAAVEKGSADTAEGLADRRNAFLQYAQVVLAASASLDEGTKASVRSQLEVKAASLGLTDSLKILEAQASQTGNAIEDAAKRASDAWTKQIHARDAASAASFNASVQEKISAENTAAATDKLEKSYTEYGDAADAAALATQGVTANTSHANEGMAALATGIANARGEFQSISAAAAQFYDTVLKGQFDIGHSEDGSGFDRAARAMSEALQRTTDQIQQQRAQLAAEIADVNDLGTAGNANFGEFGKDASQAAERMRQLAAEIEGGAVDAGLLGKQELGPLQQALEAAAQRADALAQKIKEANQQLEDVGRQLQDELDQANGNNVAVENRRFQDQLKKLKELAEAANQLNSEQYRQDVANAEALHQKKLKDIQAEQQAQNGGGGSSNTKTSTGTPGLGGGGDGSGGGGGGGFGNSGVTINVHVGTVIGSDLQKAAEDLARPMLKELQRIQSNSSKPILGR